MTTAIAERTDVFAAAPLLYESAVAHEAWSRAEREYIGTFDQRCELCNYAEWLTRRALAAVRGEEFTDAFEGVPKILIDIRTFEVERVTATQEDVQSLMEGIAK